MSIFHNRIVLKNGTVIMPENIDRVEVVGRGRSTIVSYDVERKNTYSVIAEEGMFRTDRATGMADIYENSRVKYHSGDDRDFYECEGTVVFRDGEFLIEWDDYTIHRLYSYDRANLTVTGMVLFGEDER
jgi:hypothetical protein